jgi:signal transduction histidine kinase/ActR/RegA family two-component response regulator
MAPPLPANESARLAALRSYAILDTPPEREYDDLVALAAEICATPLASITLVDEARQWFKASLGFGEKETPRDISFCAHAIAEPGDELFVVPDAAADPRFAGYSNVTGAPGIRFYAGAALVTADGYALGTLCVLDRQPRRLTPEQERALRVLRRHVINALELRRALNAQEAAIASLNVAQGELENQRLRAVAATEAKSRFLATMSHEIRTPLNAVVGMTEFLTRSALTPPQSEAIETIRTSSQLLLRLVNDILDLAKIESGRLELEEAPFSPAACVDQAVRLVRPAAEAKALALNIHLAPDLPARVGGDVTRLTQILVNLLGNAVKFTSTGHIDLTASSHPRPNTAEVELRFAITDTGIGIHAEQLARLFQEFSQADSSTTRHYGGTGLGLAISQRLAQLHGGAVQVQSTPGQGSTFTLSIVARRTEPAPAAPAPAAPAPASPGIDASFAQKHPARVLVADDNPVNRQLVARQLQRLGYKADVAEDGALALELWRKEKHDLLLLDVEMPNLDGLQAATAIRAEGGPKVTIVMLTAHATEEARTRCLAAGANERLAKPLTIGDLASTLDRLLTARDGG